MSFQLPVWFVYVLLVSWKVTSTWLIFLGRFVPPKKRGTKMMGILTDSRNFLFTPHLHSKSFGSTHTSFTFGPEILEMLEMLFRTWNYRNILPAFPGIANKNSDHWSGRESYWTKQPTTFLCEAEAREKVDSFSTLSHGLLPFFTSKSFRMTR